ncbi:hypothetical protein K8D10_22515, partial [Aeromonas veronii]|uniref:hypothetical protein n=1 Tax=Aeromonas veronii TaxID=654 RepID=UPI00207D706E
GGIYINSQGDSILTFVEIPIFDTRALHFKSQKIMDLLCSDESIFMRIKENKIIMFSELHNNMMNLECELANKLQFFNDVFHQIKS